MIKKDLNFGDHSIDTLLEFGHGTIGVNVCYDEEHNIGLVTFDQLDGFYEIGSEIEGTREIIVTPITELGTDVAMYFDKVESIDVVIEYLTKLKKLMTK